MSNSYLDEAYDIYFKSVSNIAENRFELALWSAWGSGAAFIDGGLSAIQGFNEVSNTLDKAKYLVNLFIQPMICMWYHNWEKQELYSGDEMFETRKISFKNVQTFLGIESSAVLRIHWILSAEFDWQLTKANPSYYNYIGMFHQRYLECITGKNIVEWDNLRPPIKSWEYFQNQCDQNRYKLLYPESSMATFLLIMDASVHMNKEFKRIYAQK